MSGYFQVSTTTDNEQAAGLLAESAVAAGLAASAQVFGPVHSYFWHLGELGRGQEWQVMLKTTTERYADLEAHLLREHPWDSPEVTAVELVAGARRYFEWLDKTAARGGSAD